MKKLSFIKKNYQGFTLLEVVISMGILALLAGMVYAVVSSAINASQTAMTQQLTLRRLDAFLRVTRDAFLNLPAQGTVTLEIGKSQGGEAEQRLVLSKPQEIFGIPSLAGGSLVLAARACSDGTRTLTMLTIPSNATERQRAEALSASGTPLLPKLRKPRWTFKTSQEDKEWALELPSGSPKPHLIRLQMEIDELPTPVDAIFYLPSVAIPLPRGSTDGTPPLSKSHASSTMNMGFYKKSQSGMALPMVLWTIALLAGITLLLAGIIQGWITEETYEGKQFRARQQALSGLALAMNPNVGPGDPLLNQKSRDDLEGYSVTIKDEAGLINPNTLLAATPDRRDLLQKLFTAWKLDLNECASAADGLYDWQSPSPIKSLHGAKNPEYAAVGRAGFPPNAPFTSPSEMALVLGFASVMDAKPDWKSYFTTYFNGKINILHAPKAILTDFLGITSDQADQWIALRSGKDGIDGSNDDLKVDTIANAVTLIGCSGAQKTLVLDACDVTGSVRRIESTGFCNGVKRRITVILAGGATDNAQSHGNLLSWSEQ